MMLTNCLKRYPLSHLVAVVIVILSLYPFGEIEIMGDVPLADKWTHMVMYGGFTIVIWSEYWHHHAQPQWSRLILWGIIAPIVMSGVMELLQAYATTYRSGEWFDLLANSIGVALGTGIGLLIWALRK